MDKIKWNSRKVMFGLLLISVGVGMELLSPRGLTETMAMFLGAIGAAYFAGNVAAKVAEGRTAPHEEQDANTVDLGVSINASLRDLSEQMAADSASLKEGLTTLINSNSYIIQRAWGAEKQKGA